MDGLKIYTIFVPEIKNYLETKNFWTLKKILAEISPLELAEGWGEFSNTEKLLLFRLLTANRGLQLFEELESKDQEYLLSTIRNEEALYGSLSLAIEERLQLFRPLGERFLKQLQAQARKQRLLAYMPQAIGWPENSAGALMQHEFFCVEPAWKVNMTLERLRASARLKNVGELYALYVTDKENRLLGILSLRTLIAAPPDSKITDIMWPVGLLKVRPEMDQEEVAQIFTKYNLTSLPVVDHANKLLGTVVIDDVLNVLHQEATEDIAKMAGTQAAELTRRKVHEIIILRMPWLIITCAGGYLVANIVRGFEETLSRFVALSSFMPFIAAMGGNIGTQSSTIAIRALATGEWKMDSVRHAIRTDFLVGLAMGLTYGGIAAIFAHFLYGERFGGQLPFVVGVATVISLTTGSTIGALEPFIFTKLKIDPATASGPLVTTTTDLVSVFSYLLIATALLH